MNKNLLKPVVRTLRESDTAGTLYENTITNDIPVDGAPLVHLTSKKFRSETRENTEQEDSNDMAAGRGRGGGGKDRNGQLIRQHSSLDVGGSDEDLCSSVNENTHDYYWCILLTIGRPRLPTSTGRARLVVTYFNNIVCRPRAFTGLMTVTMSADVYAIVVCPSGPRSWPICCCRRREPLRLYYICSTTAVTRTKSPTAAMRFNVDRTRADFPTAILRIAARHRRCPQEN
ncbi:Hypothetical protein CINCED_3A009957 [Cinara cedri]|uniref:Uncharacterized protein n=1 Tax=Cinara cedri TaxID=506608 RepID=A0A5E4NJ04_9HEMI|nr:Hypothetical protein CINCED_3A009957 [Cinara cedri]